MGWNDVTYVLAFMLVLGVLLIFLGKPLSEGFTDTIPCGVDKAPCPGLLKCVNGFCAATAPKRAYEKQPVPMLPEGGAYPFDFA